MKVTFKGYVWSEKKTTKGLTALSNLRNSVQQVSISPTDYDNNRGRVINVKIIKVEMQTVTL